MASQALEMRTRYMILLLLAEGPKTGYELIKRMKSLLAEVGGGASPGTVYPVLRDLEEEGYIESSEEPHGARQRKVYRITEKGVEQLLRMINKGLYIVEATIRLHLAAARNLAQTPRPELLPLVEEIVGRLARIEVLTGELLELLQRILQRNITSSHTTR
ncbi:Transcriptional regulator, PadR family [Pyrodictium delaneyi]|uniref:Transcriptional regulator n=1 Tax=Pyrodictium delaneyi TaxID=1273541 RepID=A0A0P0N5N5_9CREN|nr:PadR family transcriptional regulator [Pyrodictium delaneyi]ALL01807.1 Transcriptional regulator, PadR family [Pyrodictium delaneyi]OWJ54977.1 transcriptional regulator [Pyrodictium delaneyi]